MEVVKQRSGSKTKNRRQREKKKMHIISAMCSPEVLELDAWLLGTMLQSPDKDPY
jgi:hypothetical protein